MNRSNLVTSLVGLGILAYGFVLIFSVPFVRWGLRFGPSRLLVVIMGEDRAIKVSRFVFGPLVVLVGLLLALAIFMPNLQAAH